jgi:hypothetical protein
VSAALVVMAAGLGSRFGGAKQVEAVGPRGELLIEYGLYDARRAGLRRVVFVTRRDLSEAFAALIGRLPAEFDVRIVHQATDQVPAWFTAPGRVKPWGTVHAVLAARPAVDGSFVVINADDFYGRGAYELAAGASDDATRTGDFAIVGYRLDRTLSDHGPVARGVTRTDGRRLVGVEETRDIARGNDGTITGRVGDEVRTFSGAEIVSMNCWVFPRAVFGLFEEAFEAFLRHEGQDPRAEAALPEAVNAIVRAGRARVNVVEAPGPWFGMTHADDRDDVRGGLAALVAESVYPAPLW